MISLKLGSFNPEGDLRDRVARAISNIVSEEFKRVDPGVRIDQPATLRKMNANWFKGRKEISRNKYLEKKNRAVIGKVG